MANSYWTTERSCHAYTVNAQAALLAPQYGRMRIHGADMSPLRPAKVGRSQPAGWKCPDVKSLGVNRIGMVPADPVPQPKLNHKTMRVSKELARDRIMLA